MLTLGFEVGFVWLVLGWGFFANSLNVTYLSANSPFCP